MAGVNRAAAARGGFWLLAGMLPLLVAFWAEHARGMAPCALCLLERWPYRTVAVLGMVWLVAGAAGRTASAMRWPITAVLLVGLGIAAVHVGVEQHWWPSPLPECAAPHFTAGLSFAERLASMPAHPAKPCDAPNRLFTWLPPSMTTLDALYAAILLLLALLDRPERRVG